MIKGQLVGGTGPERDKTRITILGRRGRAAPVHSGARGTYTL